MLIAVYLKQMPPSDLLAVGIFSFLTLFPEFSGHITLSLSTEPSPIVGVYLVIYSPHLGI